MVSFILFCLCLAAFWLVIGLIVGVLLGKMIK